ncbi:MAG: methanogenesis marker protein Mmp4/MtxX [Methanospirillaceae archaeon]|nr:methanogenesis marker protein Mmp4/MtxX [Methanospirillaceae archaeon]
MSTIGIGVDTDPDRVFQSISNYQGSCRIVCYRKENNDITHAPCEVITSNDPGRALITDLLAGVIQAGIRGTLPAHDTLTTLRTAAGLSHLERIVLLESAEKRKFFLAPVGIDEGWTVRQKISLIRKGILLLQKSDLSQSVGVLSGGRMDDIGRHPKVDWSMADALLVCQATGATCYGILLEDALKECGLIIAPDGISGNLIFRTLVFAGAGASHGAPVVNLDKIFIDTSRVNPSYIGAIELASSLINKSAP